MTASVTQCLECNAPLSPAETSGLCPKCLLKLGLASHLTAGTLPVTAPGLMPDGAITEPFDFGHYRVLRLLGKGGMGAVYEAEDRESQRRVALKVLGHTLDTAEMRQRFLREGQIAASVRHPNVVAVFGAEEIEGTPVIAMELVPGGTLKDRVSRKGPMPVAEAVDAVLHIIDGLETAHAAGVLHRDVKPANCFVAPDGTVKVGDFGLSISTLAKAEVQLTASGTVLGTPAFAAPEQLRGRDVDVRSDIYAVGATLFYLLTGRPTHDAEGLVSLIAAVLETEPPDPTTLRSSLPRSLSRVVLRCLAKESAARFQSYATLREALLPFSSTAPTPAVLGMRFLAGLIDATIVSAVPLLWMLIAGNRPIDILIIERTPHAWLIFLAATMVELLYFALPEGLWGASLGKMLFGLRVVRATEKTPPGILRALARVAMIYSFEWMAALAASLTFTGAEYARALAGPVFVWSDSLTLLFPLLFITMRRRNGFAAVHDLLTGTRVIAKPSAVARPGFDADLATTTPAISPDRIGPYAVVERQGTVIRGWDEVLHRAVWILMRESGAPPVSSARREINRASRLRWLAGQRTESAAWDAYEAPVGEPLTRYLDREQPWNRVRHWLLDLAEEMNGALADGTLPPETGFDRVWITRDGRAVLLEFPAPGATPARLQPLTDTARVQAFLHSIASTATMARIPLHAREFLQSLGEHRFEAAAVVAGNLRSLLHKPATFSRARRIFTVALPAIFALVSTLIFVGGIAQVLRDFDKDWAREYPGKASLRHALELFTEKSDLAPEQSEQLSIYVAGHFREVIENQAFWSKPETIAAISQAGRWFALDSIARHPVVTPEALAKADQQIRPEIVKFAEWNRWLALFSPPFVFALFLALLLALGAAWAPFGRAPFAIRLTGGVFVNHKGAPASRWRVSLRTVVVLVPALVCTHAVLRLWSEERHGVSLLLIGLSVSGFLLGGIWAVVRPQRGLPDMIAGTWLVPR